MNNSHGAIFIIDDGCQPKIELASKERNVIAATFTHFLLKNIGGSETFKDKQDFFYHEVRLVRSNRTQQDTRQPHGSSFLHSFLQVRKFHSNYYHEKISVKVQRDKILESSMKATKHFSVSDWCGNFEVTFQGEQGRFEDAIKF